MFARTIAVLVLLTVSLPQAYAQELNPSEVFEGVPTGEAGLIRQQGKI